ncbi:MAG: hypothetical protein M1829_003370 [Trizodia sp. TS-e1964]|nr:MAG: hypothetical protein M1829_003370 [Trizodia sp. TS-e1964]
MPAQMDDPASPAIYRNSGVEPFPSPDDPLPPNITRRLVTLRDRVTIATLIPVSSPSQIPPSLLAYLCDQLNREIEKGDTYPMLEPLSTLNFASYWFANFGAIMILGNIDIEGQFPESTDWGSKCLGSFYIKPNYPGRSSHVCNGGFLVTDASRNRGVGRLMGESYVLWAPLLGYAYSVFNLVYETNLASCRIWDSLGFKRIGRVKGCGNLKSFPDQFIDAIIFGRDLGPEGEDFVTEERFDKIKFYLKHGKYPNGASRAEKSRLRSASTHYKLLEGDVLMLKDKEVISCPQRQYEISRNVHMLQHAGINKTTAIIAERYHWIRIKETVSLVIKNCNDCKEVAKPSPLKMDVASFTPKKLILRDSIVGTGTSTRQGAATAAGQVVNNQLPNGNHVSRQSPEPSLLSMELQNSIETPLDPQLMDSTMMEDVRHHLEAYNQEQNTGAFVALNTHAFPYDPPSSTLLDRSYSNNHPSPQIPRPNSLKITFPNPILEKGSLDFSESLLPDPRSNYIQVMPDAALSHGNPHNDYTFIHPSDPNMSTAPILQPLRNITSNRIEEANNSRIPPNEKRNPDNLTSNNNNNNAEDQQARTAADIARIAMGRVYELDKQPQAWPHTAGNTLICDKRLENEEDTTAEDGNILAFHPPVPVLKSKYGS